uniref:Uncharacterized protein n=1 Tax=Vespula pensylvanica TaxID=30213 RepID=A0A834P371_VESPE|nr:hypothetical protein H0235_006587 [Vespula pensylvanica]
MGSKCPRKCKYVERSTIFPISQRISIESSRPEDNENNETEADPEKREAVQKNSTESASVQAKMSLDLIVEQLKHEISLKDIEDKEQSVPTTEEEAAEPKDFFETAFEEGPKVVEHEERGATTDEDEETTDAADVNVVSMNLEKFETEERETIDRQEEEETISPREPADETYERKEENLYGLIRSMIAAEVKRYEERERQLLRKVRSDTTDVGGSEDASGETEKEEDEDETRKISKRLSVENDMVTENRLERDNDDVGFTSMFVIGPKKSSDSFEERKINEGGNTSTKDDDKNEEEEEEGGFKDRETQTERVHTIHAARSCPLRKRCIYRFFFADPHNRAELFGWIHRKASDNLIYEKGKASGSPSYVPLTERLTNFGPASSLPEFPRIRPIGEKYPTLRISNSTTRRTTPSGLAEKEEPADG